MVAVISFFQKSIKGGVLITVEELKIFKKLTSKGDDYSVLERTAFCVKYKKKFPYDWRMKPSFQITFRSRWP